MRNLLQILIKYYAFILFLILESVAFSLIVNKNNFQHSVAFRAINSISSGMYSISSSVINYFNLRDINNSLSEENTNLKNQIVKLENQLNAIDSAYIPSDNNITYIEALVINNSVNRPNNYMLINKGLRDGVNDNMAVVGADGIVGIVSTTSNQFAIVETLLNNKSSFSSRLSRTGEVGQLKWDGISFEYAELADIPRHVSVSQGDTVVTSGYSTIFPRDIMIGTVEKASLTESDATYNIKVRLATNFKNIRYVKVIKNNNAEEIEKISQYMEN